jgi:tetrahydromethanopterin S-methyltransferase subunit G
MGILNKLREYIKTPEKPVEPIDNQNIVPVIEEINKKLDKLDDNLEFIEEYLSKKFKTFEKKA